MSKESLFLLASAFCAAALMGSVIVKNGANAAQTQPAPVTVHITPAQERELFPDGVPQKQAIIEFADYECPPCKHAYQQIHDVLAAHPDVPFVFHQFPLTRIHPRARRAAYLAEAARQQNKFLPMHDFLFAHSAHFSDAELHQFLRQENLNAAELEKFAASRASEAIRRDKMLGEAMGVQGTPTIFLCESDGSYQIVAASALPALLRP